MWSRKYGSFLKNVNLRKKVFFMISIACKHPKQTLMVMMMVYL